MLSHVLLSTSTIIDCQLSLEGPYEIVHWVYLCDVITDPQITTRKSANLTDVNGHPRQIFVAVFGFLVQEKTLHFFPKGLEKYFPNLDFIKIERCGLKVIQQSDLKPFSKLNFIDLSYNSIEVIEKGLFDFNPKLKVVGFRESKIFHIDPNVFDNLSNIKCFWFDNVSCLGYHFCDSARQLKNAFEDVKKRCKNSDFVTLNKEIEELKNDTGVLNSEEFKRKFKDFERKFNDSSLSRKFYLTEKVKNLKFRSETFSSSNM